MKAALIFSVNPKKKKKLGSGKEEENGEIKV